MQKLDRGMCLVLIKLHEVLGFYEVLGNCCARMQGVLA